METIKEQAEEAAEIKYPYSTDLTIDQEVELIGYRVHFTKGFIAAAESKQAEIDGAYTSGYIAGLESGKEMVPSLKNRVCELEVGLEDFKNEHVDNKSCSPFTIDNMKKEEGFDYTSRNLKDAIVKADNERSAEEAAKKFIWINEDGSPADETYIFRRGFVKGHESGKVEGFESRQPEVDQLKATIEKMAEALNSLQDQVDTLREEAGH